MNRQPRKTIGLWCRCACLLVLATAGVSGQVFRAGMRVGEQEAAKGSGFSVRKEPAKFNDALEDFLRYRDKKAWELAFRSLETLGEGKRDGMVTAGDGFFVPSRQRILSSLTTLPPDGKEAFRLFYDAKARQLFDRAQGATDAQNTAIDEITTLREIFDKYLISSVGEKAADRLGDAQFESGDFAAAAATWRSAMQAFPDGEMPRLRSQIKRCTALARAGHWGVFDIALREVQNEFPTDKVKVAGKEVVAVEYLHSLRAAATTQPTTTQASATQQATGPLQLPPTDKPAWQIKLLDDTLLKKLAESLNNNNWGMQISPVRNAIPASASDGARVYINWLGIVFAADAKTGKMLWRNRKFTELGEKFQQLTNMMVDTDCYSATVDRDRLLVTGVNLDRLNNYEEPVRLVCMTAATGKLKWSSNSGSLGTWNFLTPPVPVAGDILYAVARQGSSADISLLAIGAEKGDLLWQVLLGTAQGGSNIQGGSEIPMPVIVPAGPTVYVVTNNGALVSVDVTGRRVEWAFTYTPPPVQNQQDFWNARSLDTKPQMPAAAFVDGATFYLKEQNGSSIYAIDLSGPSLLWRRPLDRENSIASLAGGRLLSIGQDIGAIDARSDTRLMKWCSPLPPLEGQVRPLIDDERVLAFVPRGIYEFNLANGDTVRILRGADRDSVGGTLQRTPGRLISISNLAVTAYSTSTKEGD